MKIRLDCIVCFMRQALKASRLSTSDKKIQEKVLRSVMEELLKLDWSSTPPELAHRVHSVVKQVTGVKDPYREVKRMSNDHALKLLPRLKKIIEESVDPLETAARLAIAGNVIDFAVYDDLQVEETMMKVLNQDFAINDYEAFREKTLESKNLLFFADNAGEIVFDKALIETMIEARSKPYDRITYVVKGRPILNDATLEDVEYVNLTSLSNISFETILSEENVDYDKSIVEEWFRKHDFVIAKGQGNYERFSGHSNIFFLLLVKCPVIAGDLRVSIGDIVLKYNE